jgi:hypothetical protein
MSSVNGFLHISIVALFEDKMQYLVALAAIKYETNECHKGTETECRKIVYSFVNEPESMV